MYVYLEPYGGFNDILSSINDVLVYCNTHKRILLVNGEKSYYNVDFGKYFKSQQHNIIFCSKKIEDICNMNYTIYPDVLNGKMRDILDGNITFSHSLQHIIGYYNDIELSLPTYNVEQNIIIHCRGHGGVGYKIFKELIFTDSIKQICKERYNKLDRPYLCIQIRNTDYKNDYVKFFNERKHDMRLFQQIYISTDDKNTIEFYINNGLNIANFTTFPKNDYYNLHSSNINPETKFTDMLCDIYIAGMSDKLFSNSMGGFINLIRDIIKDKDNLIQQFI